MHLGYTSLVFAFVMYLHSTSMLDLAINGLFFELQETSYMQVDVESHIGGFFKNAICPCQCPSNT